MFRKIRLSFIVALRNEKGSYNKCKQVITTIHIVALRNEKGSYNRTFVVYADEVDCSTAK